MTASMNVLMSSLALPLLLSAPLVTACASTPATQSEHQREEKRDLSQEQLESRAAAERQQSERRADLAAHQAGEDLNAEAQVDKAAATFTVEQSKYAISAKEQLAKIDARIVELRRLGKTIEPATTHARDAVAAHLQAFDDEAMSRDAWIKHCDALDSEMVALDNQVDRVAGTRR